MAIRVRADRARARQLERMTSPSQIVSVGCTYAFTNSGAGAPICCRKPRSSRQAPVLDQTAMIQTDDVNFHLADVLAGRRQAQKGAVVGAMVPLPDRHAIAGGEDIFALQLATALRKPASRVEPAVDSSSSTAHGSPRPLSRAVPLLCA